MVPTVRLTEGDPEVPRFWPFAMNGPSQRVSASAGAIPVEHVLVRANIDQTVLVHFTDQNLIDVDAQDSVVRIAASAEALEKPSTGPCGRCLL